MTRVKRGVVLPGEAAAPSPAPPKPWAGKVRVAAAMASWGVRRELSVVWFPRASADGAKELCCTWKGIDKLKRITAFTCGERLARAQKPLPCAREVTGVG